ncbi:DUF4397 domain-containing protein [Pseudonocardia sp. KRD291]|uniref:DUF4397 domain-containing protein n=1 Tax=Pseudonocardia sp. KRD291 TaxID=2792007 RepID=UPI001C49F610|nr:DUF4397 domain-containing protein [Pseudonocardia sp. KRD291]MBW0101575.1 DUF4397 domain-containing protein [Pseudonocardia sp. KRD291]
MRRHRLRHQRRDRLLGLLGMALLVGAATLATAPIAGAQEPTGQIRLGHLSPTTPGVDITLSGPEGPSSVDQRIASGAAYGAVTGYLKLVPGRYTISMRPAGSDPNAEAPLAAGLQVAAGTAQSLLFFDNGSGGSVRGELVNDDLSVPTAADGKVRLVQGADGLPPLQALAVDGPKLATDLAYGTVTDYATVAAKTWDVRLSAGGQTLAGQLPVGGGSVNTVVVTRDTAGKLAVKPLADVAGLPVGIPANPTPSVQQPSGAPEAAAPAAPAAPKPPAAKPAPQQQIPIGGVPAGAGATAGGGPGVLPILLALAGAPLLVFSMSSMSAARRRSSG